MNAAELIVHVRVTGQDSRDNQRRGVPRELSVRVRFDVLGVIKGNINEREIRLNGRLDDRDDYNDRDVPYGFVRRGGRSGMCYAHNYRQGAEYLLLLRKDSDHRWSPYWSPLMPTNEQLRGAADPWLKWVTTQVSVSSQPSRPAIISAARDVVEKARYCSLVTLGEDGHPQARTVDPIAPDADFTMWIATNPLTRKTAQIKRDPRVTLTCFDSATASYVTLLGRAALVSDAASKRAHWKPAWSGIYKDGPDSRDVVLIRVTPMRLEIVSESRGMVGDPKTWLPLAVDFRK